MLACQTNDGTGGREKGGGWRWGGGGLTLCFLTEKEGQKIYEKEGGRKGREE